MTHRMMDNQKKLLITLLNKHTYTQASKKWGCRPHFLFYINREDAKVVFLLYFIRLNVEVLQHVR
jgi:hypothetical protein